MAVKSDNDLPIDASHFSITALPKLSGSESATRPGIPKKRLTRQRWELIDCPAKRYT